MKLDVVVPIELSSSALGGSKGKGRWHGEAVRAQREETKIRLTHADGKDQASMSWFGHPGASEWQDRGARITLLRPYASSPLDDDNLASVFKAVRDGVADFLGVDDGSPRLFFRYAQCKARSTGKKPSKNGKKLVPDYDTHIRIRIEIVAASDVDPMQTAVRGLVKALTMNRQRTLDGGQTSCFCAENPTHTHAHYCLEARAALAHADALATFDPQELYNV